MRTRTVEGIRLMSRATVMRVSVALVCALGWTSFAADASSASDFDYQPPAPGSYKLPLVKAAADGEVLDSAGKPVRLRDLTHGRATVMSFIYTRCAAARACPYATSVLKHLYQLSAEDPVL